MFNLIGIWTSAEFSVKSNVKSLPLSILACAVNGDCELGPPLLGPFPLPGAGD